MGNLIWHEYARFVAITASVYGMWAGYWGIFYRKFFWDFVGGTLRDPGGLQPGPAAAPFVTIIVKAPVLQIFAVLMAFFMLALEWPLPLMRKLPIYRNLVVRIVLLFFQAFINILYYQRPTTIHATVQQLNSFVFLCKYAVLFSSCRLDVYSPRINKTLAMTADEIIAKIPDQYRKAKDSGDLFFFPSTIVRHREEDADVEFQITLCPALENKPQQNISPPSGNSEASLVTPDANAQTKATDKKSIDPFAPPYNENLYVGEIKDEESEEEYVVLLNKFSVVPNHFLLVSKEYKSQSSPLLPPDLVQTYKLLIAARKAGRKNFAFYNCGNMSGASQPHKHVQFIPIEATEAGPPIERLARSIHLETPSKPFTISRVPYANHVVRLPQDLQYEDSENLERVLAGAFLSLLDLVISTIRHAPDYPVGNPSYNVILTLEHMHLIPRRYENFVLPGSGDVISVNSLGYAGMLLVKTDEELENVKAHGITKILRAVGLESVHEARGNGFPRARSSLQHLGVAPAYHKLNTTCTATISLLIRYKPSIRYSQHASSSMTPPPWTPVSLQSSRTRHARAQNSSEVANLQGKPAKTPIIAGSVCGGVLLLAWIIGFSLYFRKRYVRKKLKRAAAAIGRPPPELKSRPETEKVVIPPDPAVLLGQRAPGYAFSGTNGAQVIVHPPQPLVVLPDRTASKPMAGGVGVGRHIDDSGVGQSGLGSGASGERAEERAEEHRTAELPDISVLKKSQDADKDHEADTISGVRADNVKDNHMELKHACLLSAFLLPVRPP
ncbi:hypothetical protein NP233_g6952 [Leucocoprinus birnbaumii]|uniref:ATP adenylyltransferase n=1 Tax=Leucocoprinus birnbaumii TaxID=56174 RepID=A0AAD5VVN6_9AGAR|nr:hypothetical protein NP233_g6952 [Leucocoprinus birnbaumii]